MASSPDPDIYENLTRTIKKDLGLLKKNETNVCNHGVNCNKKNECEYWHPPKPLCYPDLNNSCTYRETCKFYHFDDKTSPLRNSAIAGLKMKNKHKKNKNKNNYNNNYNNNNYNNNNNNNLDDREYNNAFNYEYGKVQIKTKKNNTDKSQNIDKSQNNDKSQLDMIEEDIENNEK